MSMIGVSADGTYLFLALEDASGNQIIARAGRADLTAWARAYNPGAGSAGNVVQVPANADQMLFHGNFGTDIVIIKHTISTGANSDVSPASLGAKIINTLRANPSNEEEWACTVDTDQDIIHTADDGASYETWDNALGFNAAAAWVFWSGAYYLDRYFVAGDNGIDLDILYSPNEGSNDTNVEGATIGAADAVVSLEATEA